MRAYNIINDVLIQLISGAFLNRNFPLCPYELISKTIDTVVMWLSQLVLEDYVERIKTVINSWDFYCNVKNKLNTINDIMKC